MDLYLWAHRRCNNTIVAWLSRKRRGLSIFLLASVLLGCGGQSSVDNKAQAVTILGLVQNEQQEKLEAALRPFEERTGIVIEYEGRFDFASVLPARVAAGNPPDIAMFPQPALIEEFALSGDLVPLSFLDDESLQRAYSDSWLDLVAVDGMPYGIWYRASVKSLVWYRPTAFKENNYDVPKSWDAMIELSNTIVDDGDIPWCIGLQNDDASGWPGTDWIEDILLRTARPQIYDQIVARETPFASSQMLRAFELFGDILSQPPYTEGGALGTVTTDFLSSPLGLFDEPPSCYMHRQANFISSFFPENKQPTEDYDAFLLPPIDPQFGAPVLIGGDAFSMFNDTPAARQFIAYINTPEPHEIWAGLGGYISPRKDVPASTYTDPVNRKAAQLLSEANVVRFDLSDSIPPSVRDQFWQGMIDFAAGKPAEEVTQSIDEAWPQP